MAEHDDARADSTSNMRCCGCAQCGASGRDDALWRVAAAECCGTALLVLLSCLPGCGLAAPASPMHRAVASGLVVALLVQCLDHVSGAQLNPTVTLAALLWGRVSGRRALALGCAQLAGAAAGAALLRLLAPPARALCLTLPAPGLAVYKAVVIEAVAGGCLALANCASWDARNRSLRDSWPLRIGLSVAGLSLVAGELTGASMNPARSFGPALWSGNWANHWVYWVGPLSGSVMFTGTYLSAWRSRITLASGSRGGSHAGKAPPLPGKAPPLPGKAPPLPGKTRADP